jgi:hypothetical protein
VKPLALPLALLAGLGCEGGEPVPASPTWVADVEPILRGNCFHCHGPAANPLDGQLRWDFYDPQDPQMAAIGAFPAISAAKIHIASFLITKSYALGSLTQMPPPPATVLSDRDVEVLRRWQRDNSPRGMRAANQAPTAFWLVRGKTFVVTDGDHEQVLGKVTCGGSSALLASSGAHDVPPGAQAPCAVTLFDGQTLVRDVSLP